MNASLAGLTLLVTRPDPAGAELCSILEAAGAQPVHFPTIAIKLPNDIAAFHTAIEHLGEQDWLIFTSPQAVYQSVSAIRQRWPHFSAKTQFAAIGAGTARALEEAGYHVAVIPTQWNSEGLLNLPEFQWLTKQKIALIRGEGGRALLAEELTKRGAKLTHVIAYQRSLPESSLIKPNMQKINAILSHSYESVLNLTRLLPKEEIIHKPLLVPSDRIKLLAANLGFQTIWVTNNASHPAFVTVLQQKRKELWPNQT